MKVSLWSARIAAAFLLLIFSGIFIARWRGPTATAADATARRRGGDQQPSAVNRSMISKLALDADLALTMTDLPDPSHSDTVYTLSVVNNGPDEAVDVIVTDTLAAGQTLLIATSSQGSCTGSAPITCNLDALAARAQATVTITARSAAPGDYINRAQVTSATPDSNTDNNTATEETRRVTTVSIYGRVTLANGAGLSGVIVSSGNPQKPPVTTRADGAYQFADLPFGGTGMFTITPTLPGYVFNPPSQMRSYLNGDNRADFTAVACTFTLAPANQSFAPAGGAGTVRIIAADPQCSWTARSNASWLKIISASSGNGSGMLSFTVDPAVGARSGTLTIADQTFSVTQEFNACAQTDFSAPPTFVLSKVAARSAPPRFVLRDLNGDARPDLAFITESPGGNTTHGVAVALANAEGGFAAQRQVAASFGLLSLVDLLADDFNGDGKPDLAALARGFDSSQAIFVANEGNGGFAPPVVSLIAMNATRFAAGDFNGDARPDLAFVGGTSGARTGVLLNNGAGAFATTGTTALGQSIFGGHLAVGDFNDDGWSDVAVVDGFQNLYVLFGNGAGSLGAPILNQVINGSRHLVVGDFNGDGRADLLIVAGAARLYVGNGNGRFGPPTDLALGTRISDLSVADINRDEALDLVAANVDGVTIRLGAGGASFQAPVSYSNGTINDGSSFYTALTVGDYNGDGWADIYNFGLIGSDTSRTSAHSGDVGLTLLLAAGEGEFRASRNFTPARFEILLGAAVGDLDGDGGPDLVAINNTRVLVLRGNGRGEFAPSVDYGAGTWPRAVQLADFNSDGMLDIIVANEGSSNLTLLTNNGRGQFPLSSQIAAGANSRVLGVGDFNGDNLPDLVIKSQTRGLRLLLGNGNSDFTRAADELAAEFQSQFVTIGDFNGDGHLDLIAPHQEHTGCDTRVLRFALLIGDGQGGFAPPITINASANVGEQPISFQVADFNQDGRADLLFTAVCGLPDGLYIMLANGQNGFAAPVKYEVGAGAINPLTSVVADFNNDGKPDVVVLNRSTGNLSLLLGVGDGSFQSPVLLPVAAAPMLATTGDVNQDGTIDLVLLREQSDNLTVLLNRTNCLLPGGAVLTSAASYARNQLAPNAIAALFGVNISATTQAATTLPLPTMLGGVSVQVKDSLGVAQLAPLFFVSPNQINYLIPPSVALGIAIVTVTSGANAIATGTVVIAAAAPGLFTADASGRGLAAATVLRVKADGTQMFEAVAQFDQAQQRFTAAPIDVSDPAEQVFLLLYGTGLRGRSQLAAVNAQIGGENVAALYAGAQGDFAGLDQINLRLPATLSGRGEVDVLLTVDGRSANTVKINIK